MLKRSTPTWVLVAVLLIAGCSGSPSGQAAPGATSAPPTAQAETPSAGTSADASASDEPSAAGEALTVTECSELDFAPGSIIDGGPLAECVAAYLVGSVTGAMDFENGAFFGHAEWSYAPVLSAHVITGRSEFWADGENYWCLDDGEYVEGIEGSLEVEEVYCYEGSNGWMQLMGPSGLVGVGAMRSPFRVVGTESHTDADGIVHDVLRLELTESYTSLFGATVTAETFLMTAQGRVFEHNDTSELAGFADSTFRTYSGLGLAVDTAVPEEAQQN